MIRVLVVIISYNSPVAIIVIFQLSKFGKLTWIAEARVRRHGEPISSSYCLASNTF
jgi:hypothetical protein